MIQEDQSEQPAVTLYLRINDVPDPRYVYYRPKCVVDLWAEVDSIDDLEYRLICSLIPRSDKYHPENGYFLALLQALSEACRRLGISYREVWGIIPGGEKWERRYRTDLFHEDVWGRDGRPQY